MKGYPLLAKLYIVTVVMVGAAVIASAVANWECADSTRYAVYFVAFLLASALKVRLPGITGTMSLNQVFIFLGMVELSLPETILMGSVGALAQTLWQTKRETKAVHLVFNVFSMAVAIGAGYGPFMGEHVGFYGSHVAGQLLGAACGFFLVNTMLTTIVIALTESRRVVTIWRECYFWSLPYYVLGATLAGVLHVLNSYAGWQTSLLSLPALFLIYRSYSLYLERLETEKTHAQDVAALHLRTIEALAAAIEAKDENTHEHLERVQVYALEMGRKLNLSDLELQALRAASVLHDIGKLAVPEHIISKPGKLTPEEFEKMKIHPVVGAEILERVQFPYPVAPIVRHHHEKWDGSGYPDGLKGDEIPIGARILTAVDCLDALSSERQYRRALPLDQSMEIVASEAGKDFDPEIVRLLQSHYREWEKMAHRQPALRERLDTNIQVERGEAPAAGFEECGEGIRACRGGDSEKLKTDFLASIAAARQEVQALYELSQGLGASLSLEDTLSVFDSRLQSLVDYDCLVVYVRQDERLVARYTRGEEAALFGSLEIPVGEGLSGWVIEKNKAILNGNPSVEAGYLKDPKRFSILRSALAVPLEGIQGGIGVLALYRAEAGAFSREDMRILQAVTPKVALAVENALRYHQAEVSATTDGLTGLPNARSLFLHLDAELSRSRRDDTPMVVLVFDLDGFKQINDRYGHLEGNRVLTKVAGLLRETCRAYDYVARMGGDEFVVLLPGCSDATSLGKIEQISKGVMDIGREVRTQETLAVSIGVASFPEDGNDAEELLALADRRMYQEKRRRQEKKPPTNGLLALIPHAGEKEEAGDRADPQ